jgi:hypothetical protein
MLKTFPETNTHKCLANAYYDYIIALPIAQIPKFQILNSILFLAFFLGFRGHIHYTLFSLRLPNGLNKLECIALASLSTTV